MEDKLPAEPDGCPEFLVVVAEADEHRALEIALAQGHDPQRQDLGLIVLVPFFNDVDHDAPPPERYP